MKRIVKDPVVRKNELLNAAEKLFTTKGYSQTSIADIVKAVDVAKGTFYYYFQSKEQILDEILLRIIQEDVRKMELVLRSDSSPVQKLADLLLAQTPKQGDRKDQMTEEFHKPGNAEIHQKGTKIAIQHLAPLLAQAVQQGVAQGIFHTSTPLEDMEMILAASAVLFDETYMEYEEQDLLHKMQAFFKNMERVLGAEPGALTPVLEALLSEE